MKKGFSLIEIIVAISILALLGLLLANILPSVFSIYKDKYEEQERFSNVQIIFDRLAREIRQGISISGISSPTHTLGYLALDLSTGGSRIYSTTLYSGKYYFTVDNEIQAGPIKELRFVGLDAQGTYTTLTSNIRTLSITLVMEDNKKYATFIALRGETIPESMKVYISEIMYYPATTDKNGGTFEERVMEFIVVSNDNTYPISLQGWSVNGYTITVTRSGTFTLSPGLKAMIGISGSNLQDRYNVRPGYIILEVNSGYLGVGNRALDNSNDSVTLRDNLGNIIDQVNYSSTWGGTRKGNDYYSLYKISQTSWGNGPFVNYTRGNISVYCLKAPVVINEIMYYPATVDKNGNVLIERSMEFIEIQNISNQTINIQNWRVIVNDNTIITLVSGSWNIPPEGYVVIGSSGSSLNTSYNLVSGCTHVRTRRNGLAGRNASLGNSAHNVIIMDSNGIIVDQVNYSSTWGGNRIISGSTYSHFSLERRNKFNPPNDPSNWGSSILVNYTRTYGSINYRVHCTPGGANSISQ